MKTAAFTALFISLSFCATSVQARDTVHHLPVNEAIKSGKAQGALNDDIKFFFGDQPHPAIETMLNKGATTSKKTQTAGRGGDEEACNWVMQSALIQLQQTARSMGGNAVVNIESFYKRNVFRSNDQFECHAGNVVSGVALRGDIVKLK